MTATPLFPLTARAPNEPEPYLTSLVVIHRAIRRDLARLADVLGRLAAGSPAPVRAAAVRRYAMALLAEISAHHHGEGDILWPVSAAAAGQCVDLRLADPVPAGRTLPGYAGLEGTPRLRPRPRPHPMTGCNQHQAPGNGPPRRAARTRYPKDADEMEAQMNSTDNYARRVLGRNDQEP